MKGFRAGLSNEVYMEGDFHNILFGDHKIVKPEATAGKYTAAVPEGIKALVFAGDLHSEQEREQLEKILGACRIPPEHYLVISGAYKYFSFRKLADIRHIFVFGVAEESLGLAIRFRSHHDIVFFDGKTFIKTVTLRELMDNQQLKNELWQRILKPHFGTA